MADSSSTSSGVSKRGFASMDPQRKKEIASKGGRAAHEKGTAHEFTPDEARNAGRKGGEAVSRNRDHMASIGRRGGEAVSRDREHMANIGRKGGETVSRDRQHMANIGREGGESRSREPGGNGNGRDGKSEMGRMAGGGAQPGQPEQQFASPPNT
jgi:uncharacterized protein